MAGAKEPRQSDDDYCDGYTNFLFLNQNGLPKITPHSFLHTLCTRMSNKGMNPNALQYIVGHANITITLDYYAHADSASAQAEMDRLAA